jgi:group I intron endonuclease
MVERRNDIIADISGEKILCKICGREFKNYKSFSNHLRAHKITAKGYYDKFFKKEGEGICLACGKETSFISLKEGYRKFCSYSCAKSGRNSPFFGKHPSEETKKKMSEAKKGENHPNYGKHPSEETRKKMSDAHKGKHLSEKARKKLSDMRIGKRHTKETKKKISDARKGENNPMYGKHHTEETKKKMSDIKKGENNYNYGKHLSEETKKKMSEAHKGKLKGKKNPNYKGGISSKEFKDAFGIEPEEWKKIAQEVRKRDKFICQLCGKKNATDVHHIIPRRVKIDNSSENLITLCRSCHAKAEHLTDIYLAEGRDPREIFF